MKKNFYGYQKEFFELYFQNKIEAALKKAEEIDEIYPDKAYKTKYWKACLYGILKNDEKALSALEELRDSGQWFSPQLLSKEEDLKRLWYNQKFEEILDVFTERKIKALEESAPVKLEFIPAEPSEKFIVALHWRMGNAEEFSRYWKNSAKKLNMRLMALQSSQVLGTEMYCWDNMDLGKKEVKNEISVYIEERDLSESNMILAGASQGARLAFELVIEKKLNPYMLLLVVPAFRNVEGYSKSIKDLPDNLLVRMVTGGKDQFHKDVIAINEMMKKNDIDSRLKILKNMGHTFPEDFGSYLRKILD